MDFLDKQVSLKFVPQGSINTGLALVQIMTWQQSCLTEIRTWISNHIHYLKGCHNLTSTFKEPIHEFVHVWLITTRCLTVMRLFVNALTLILQDDVIKWKHFPRYWAFEWVIHRSSVTREFPAQRPVTRSFDVFFDLRLDKRLSKHWLFETPSHSLWRHCNGISFLVLIFPEVGLLNRFQSIPLCNSFHNHQSTVYLYNVTFIFDGSCHSRAAVTPVKYECDWK